MSTWTVGVCELLVHESLQGARDYDHLFNDVADCPGEVVPAITEAGLFKLATNIRLSQTVNKLLDT